MLEGRVGLAGELLPSRRGAGAYQPGSLTRHGTDELPPAMACASDASNVFFRWTAAARPGRDAPCRSAPGPADLGSGDGFTAVSSMDMTRAL